MTTVSHGPHRDRTVHSRLSDKGPARAMWACMEGGMLAALNPEVCYWGCLCVNPRRFGCRTGHKVAHCEEARGRDKGRLLHVTN